MMHHLRVTPRNLIGIFLFLFSIASNNRAQEAKKLNVYIEKGKGAESVFEYENYRKLFENTIFRGHDLTIDRTSGKKYFLETTFESDIVYYSLHSNPQKLCIATGEMVTPSDIAAARPAEDIHPKLIVVSGCETLRPIDAMSFPEAFGINEGTKKRAYIGFQTITPGLFCDRYFRAFFSLWLQPKSPGSYRTLAEAKVDAKERLTKILKLKDAGKDDAPENNPSDPSAIGVLDPAVANWFTIVGDDQLKVTDL